MGEKIYKCVQAWLVTSLCMCDVCECKEKALGEFRSDAIETCRLEKYYRHASLRKLGTQKKGRDVDLVSADGKAIKHRFV